MKSKKGIVFEVKVMTEKDVDSIMSLQDTIINGLKDKSVLRKNTKEMFESCVKSPNLTLGIFDEDKLIAITIMVDVAGTSEDLSIGLEKHKAEKSINYKLIMVKEEYRGLSLQRNLLWIFQRYAFAHGYTDMCATVSGDNIYSLNNMLACGMERDHETLKYGGLKRIVMFKHLDSSIDEIFASNNSKISNLFTYDKRLVSVGDMIEIEGGKKYIPIGIETNLDNFSSNKIFFKKVI